MTYSIEESDLKSCIVVKITRFGGKKPNVARYLPELIIKASKSSDKTTTPLKLASEADITNLITSSPDYDHIFQIALSDDHLIIKKVDDSMELLPALADSLNIRFIGLMWKDQEGVIHVSKDMPSLPAADYLPRAVAYIRAFLPNSTIKDDISGPYFEDSWD